jgi:hypothetical protein
MFFHIEIKEKGNHGFKKVVVDLVKKMGREETTALGTINESDQVELMKVWDGPMIGSTEQVIRYIFMFYSGLMPFYPVKLDFCSMPIPTTNVWKSYIEEAKEKKAYGPVLLMSFFQWINWTTMPLIRHLNKRGVLTNGWVIDEEEDVTKFLDYSPFRGI